VLEQDLSSEGNIKLICTTVEHHLKCVSASATGKSLSPNSDISRSA